MEILSAKMLGEQAFGFIGEEHKCTSSVAGILLERQYPILFEIAHIAKHGRLGAMDEVAEAGNRNWPSFKLCAGKMQKHFPYRVPQHFRSEELDPLIAFGYFLPELGFQRKRQARTDRGGEDVVHNTPSALRLAQPSAAMIRWSWIAMSNSAAHSARASVTAISAALGWHMPDGWL